MRAHAIVAAMFVATCLSGACDRSLSDGAATAPSPIATADRSRPAATRPPVPVPPAPPTAPAPPGLPGPSGLPGFVSCDHTKAQRAIGQPASNHLLERARTAAGARTARFLRPNDVITMEFLAARLNLLLDKKDIVRSMHCG